MTGLVGNGSAVDIVYQASSKVLDTMSHKIFIDKLLMYRLDEQRVRWTENWLPLGTINATHQEVLGVTQQLGRKRT